MPRTTELEATFAVDAPRPDEIEVSLFGPGVGECIVLHTGHNEWAIVDSCKETRAKKPVALEYLSQIGVDPTTSIKRIAITHWHDDHIQGIAETLEVARESRFACSVALRIPELGAIVESAKLSRLESSGVRELAAVFDVLRNRARAKGSRLLGEIDFALDHKTIYERRASEGKHLATMISLSPSSGMVDHCFRKIVESFTVPSPKRRVVDARPNEVSVVLWVRCGEFECLLGGDLEATSSQDSGWNAILGSDRKPEAKGQAYKVAHHGSPNADDPRIWSTLLLPSAHAVVAPYNRGVTPRPAPSDIARIKGSTENAFCTGKVGNITLPKRDRAVERTLKELGVDRRALTGKMGHIRVRCKATDPASPVKVALRGPAHKL